MRDSSRNWIVPIINKIAVITGAGSGIGRAAALALHREGWCIALAGRRADALSQTAKLAESPQRPMLTIAADVCDPAQVRALFEKVHQTFGRLDVLFNNAGRSFPATPTEDLTLEQWKSIVDTNLTGSFLCAQEAIKIMKSQNPRGGRIINNGSVSAQVPRPHTAAYTCAKHAITGLTKCIALDGRRHDITASQIDIGNAETEPASKVKQGVPQANGTIAIEPLMDVEHVARAIVYMASLPLDANVLNMTILASKMPFVGRG
jgi:NAD(P)-dependent dehydrogenase (short-subunit alcohol dehydrogenase family)